MSEIVVGLDLSPSARAALRWVRAVNAVDVSPAYNIELGMGGVAVPMEASALDATYREAIAAVFDSVQAGLGWRLEFFSGEAGPVLVAESVGAALLVVGTQEHAGIGRLVSGSVSHYCLSHAQCPVVAVPAVRGHGAKKDHDHHEAADTPAPA
jgi:nucleotide-binding universal stress UspA family protein